MSVIGKEASTFCILQGIANCVKMGQKKLYPPTDISVSLAAVSPRPTFGQVRESCSQFFLETKTQLWKLM